MTNLREAREKGNLNLFIKEHKAKTGDADALEKGISSMAGKSLEAPKASSRRNRGD